MWSRFVIGIKYRGTINDPLIVSTVLNCPVKDEQSY